MLVTSVCPSLLPQLTPELTVADRRQKREIRQLEQELHKWQVLVDSITGEEARGPGGALLSSPHPGRMIAWLGVSSLPSVDLALAPCLLPCSPKGWLSPSQAAPSPGMSSPDFDNQTLAVLRGRMVRYLMRSREVRQAQLQPFSFPFSISLPIIPFLCLVPAFSSSPGLCGPNPNPQLLALTCCISPDHLGEGNQG